MVRNARARLHRSFAQANDPTGRPTTGVSSTMMAVSRARKALCFASALLLTVMCVLLAAWGCGALWFQGPDTAWLRIGLMGIWVVLAMAALWACWSPASRRGLYVFAGGFLGLLVWWGSIAPLQDRQWADDVAQPLRARLEGNTLVVDNVRNFRWRSETDYDIAWERRSYPLDQVRSADVLLSYWMGPAIAHTLISFGFADGRQLVFSLEIRKERDEAFSALGGFFRKFEVVLVAADERDIVAVRTNARGEDVYLYRLAGLTPAALQALLRGYVHRAQQLERAPRFYNTLTSNCTTVIFDLVRQIVPHLPLDYRLLLSGYLAEYAQEVGGLVPGYSYVQLRDAGRITQRARSAGDAGDFSQQIRRGVPGTSEGAQP